MNVVLTACSSRVGHDRIGCFLPVVRRALQSRNCSVSETDTESEVTGRFRCREGHTVRWRFPGATVPSGIILRGDYSALLARSTAGFPITE
jgi:hypothetical protein